MDRGTKPVLAVSEHEIGFWVMGDDPARKGLSRRAVAPANLFAAYGDEQLSDTRDEIWLSDASQLSVEKCLYVCESGWHAA